MRIATTTMGAYPKPADVPVPMWTTLGDKRKKAPTEVYDAFVNDQSGDDRRILDEMTIDAVREQVERGIDHVLAERITVSDSRQCMQIRNEIEAVMLFLQFDVLANGSEVVAPVWSTGWLDSRKNAHVINEIERTKYRSY